MRCRSFWVARPPSLQGEEDPEAPILKMMAFIIRWPLVSDAPWRSIWISVYIESQAGDTTGILCSLITHGMFLKWDECEENRAAGFKISMLRSEGREARTRPHAPKLLICVSRGQQQHLGVWGHVDPISYQLAGACCVCCRTVRERLGRLISACFSV